MYNIIMFIINHYFTHREKSCDLSIIYILRIHLHVFHYKNNRIDKRIYKMQRERCLE